MISENVTLPVIITYHEAAYYYNREEFVTNASTHEANHVNTVRNQNNYSASVCLGQLQKPNK